MSSAATDRPQGVAADGLALGLSTLTVLPVGTVRADRRTAAAAMLWAPAIGAGLGALVGVVVVLLVHADTSPLLAAAIAIGVLALLTRGLHLDGLADTADGFGSGRDPQRALAVMRNSDIGPFGVITLVLVLLAQAAALGTIAARWDDHRVILAAVLVCAAGRATLPPACRRGVPAARADGLGAMVANTVPWPAAIGVSSAVAIVIVGVGWAADFGLGRSLLAVLLAAAAAEVLLRRCRSRFGGITGDVLGALVETATTVTLVVLSTT
ncbi:MAG TPA: adenosylcobinamide-GDP ribazoletransferase [Sporichthyaceae bacterium]